MRAVFSPRTPSMSWRRLPLRQQKSAWGLESLGKTNSSPRCSSRNFQQRWRLAQASSFVDRLAHIARGEHFAHFVALPRHRGGRDYSMGRERPAVLWQPSVLCRVHDSAGNSLSRHGPRLAKWWAPDPRLLHCQEEDLRHIHLLRVSLSYSVHPLFPASSNTKSCGNRH